MVESSGGAVTCAQEKWLSSLPPNIRPQVIDEGGHVVVLGRAEPYAWIVLLFLQIGMMVGMARQPPNLDNLMNEGIAFAIDRFQVSLPDCPIRRRPVIIGRRKPAYNTIDSHGTIESNYDGPRNHETHCYCRCTWRFFY